MSPLKYILQKEFKQIFRDPAIIRVIFILPIIQLIVLPMAADYEIKNINIAIVDRDHSTSSGRLVHTITSSGYFRLVDYSSNFNQAMQGVDNDKADLILELPQGFESDLYARKETRVFLAVNAINGVKANLGATYLRTIIQNYNNDFRVAVLTPGRFNDLPVIETTSSNWYNPKMNYTFFMVPGILVLLITMIALNLSAINIVREKEIGTIEQINVTPIKKVHFILGKLIPFWILGLVVITIGFLISWLVYGIIPLGSYLTIYLFAAVYLLVILGLGLLISTYAENQQQSMLISFFLLMIFVLMGGLYTSIDSMPEWAQWVTKFNPVAYFIEVMRRVVLKGSGLKDIRQPMLIMLGFALVINYWAVLSYRKRS
ncbi:MAG: ABC transporter permease [Sphingobacteriia bacterium]|nr:ABC transporter permease [Sphingobacteriia bacterium]